MKKHTPSVVDKLIWSLPWLARYPFWRAQESLRRLAAGGRERHLIFIVANHFEPSWNAEYQMLAPSVQLERLEQWCRQARETGDAIRDSDGTPFRHTNFYPAEQYHPDLLDMLAELQADGFGEVEIHLHHGVEAPDNAANLRRTLVEFRDLLAEEHNLLARAPDSDKPMYAFVHGNLALANSDGGRCCGVDEEMQILYETGCYADFTLPAAPLRPQVPRINAIYQCGRPLVERAPHRTGPDLRVHDRVRLPLIMTGPLVFDWRRRVKGLPVPRIEDGVLAANYPLDLGRLRNWQSAGISVRGREEWIFIKLYCHGFFDHDQPMMIGDRLRAFFREVIELAERSNEFKLHFASAREAFNIALAAADGRDGNPHLYRDYRLLSNLQHTKLRQANLQQANLQRANQQQSASPATEELSGARRSQTAR